MFLMLVPIGPSLDRGGDGEGDGGPFGCLSCPFSLAAGHRSAARPPPRAPGAVPWRGLGTAHYKK